MFDCVDQYGSKPEFQQLSFDNKLSEVIQKTPFEKWSETILSIDNIKLREKLVSQMISKFSSDYSLSLKPENLHRFVL